MAPDAFRPETPALPAGLARLLNAALIDPGFGALFVRSPVRAARLAVSGSGEAFGTTLPDPALRLALPELSEAEWAVLGRLPSTESLAAAARELRRLCEQPTAGGAVEPPPQHVQQLPRAVGPALPAPVAVLREGRLAGHPSLRAPASREGALAGAA